MGELYVPIVGANGLVWLWVVGGLHYVVMVETLLGWAIANRRNCNPGLQLLQFLNNDCLLRLISLTIVSLNRQTITGCQSHSEF